MEFTEKMKQDVLAAAREYIASETDDVFRSEVENAVGLGDWEGLYDRFYTSLAFGTAGMRGIIGGGTNRINTYMVRKVTQGLADYLNASVKNPSTVIAYDSRLFSDKFALSAAKVLAANGVRVYLYDTLHPVPMLSFAVRHLKATSGIVVTASHNPSKYNGIKVAYTPLHGTGNVPVRHMLSTLGIDCSVVKEQENPDGNFPTVKLPNPESAEAMEKVIALAKDIKADIVIGTDPDADRLGIAIPKNPDKSDYLLLTGNQIATLLVDYLLTTASEKQREGIPFVAKSLVTTDLVRKIAEHNGGECKDVLTGFKYIAEEIERIETGKNPGRYFLFGCEESYGFLTVTDVHDKDAVSSSVAAVEMMCYYASKGITLQERLDEIYSTYGYSTEVVFSNEYDGAEGKEKMKAIMASMRALKAGDTLVSRKIQSVEDLLGENTGFPKADVIIIRFESGEKLVVRPSGTEPKIKYYLFLTEGSDGRKALEEKVGKVKAEFMAAL